MSLAVTHFAFGTLCATLIVSLLSIRRYARSLSIASGIWALVPDAGFIAPMGAPTLQATSLSGYANLFWFHGWFDRVDPGDSPQLAAMMVGGLFLVTLFADLLSASPDASRSRT